jgi:hypothetical protein
VASGVVGTTMKFYFFAQDKNTKAFYLAEMIIKTDTLSLTAKFKSEKESGIQKFIHFFEEQIRQIVGA